MQAAIKFANACEFDHRKAFHIPHFDFFEESASASPMLFNGSASADRGRFPTNPTALRASPKDSPRH